MNLKSLKINHYINQLLLKISSLSNRQGSKAFDNIKSANQYRPAYEWVLNNVPQNSKILDWGCGIGHFSDFLFEFGYEVVPYGFDVPELLEHIGSPACMRYIRANDVTKLPFAPESFDFVFSIGVLEHVREFGGSEVSSLREIHRVLKNKGIFYCYHFPNKFSWIEFVAKCIGSWHHDYRFAKGQIYEMAELAKFRVIKCSSYGFLPRNIFGRNLIMLKLSSSISDSFFEKIDDFLETIFKKINQNWEVVLKKYE